MVTMAQSVANCLRHANPHGSHAFTHTLYINTITTTWCEAPAQLLIFQCMLFRVSAIHRTMTWTTGSLTCVRDHCWACTVYTDTGYYTVKTKTCTHDFQNISNFGEFVWRQVLQYRNTEMTHKRSVNFPSFFVASWLLHSVPNCNILQITVTTQIQTISFKLTLKSLKKTHS